ncbi:MAG: hypothetical protein ABI863_00645 [Ginsengibacter sp.]
MNLHLKITFRTFIIWLLASFINAFLCAGWRGLNNHISNEVPGDALFIFFISLFFSAPGFFIFWIILLVKLAKGIYERALFRAPLSTGFLLATATAIICLGLIKSEFSTDKYVVILFIISSSMISIMMHFNQFKKINKHA